MSDKRVYQAVVKLANREIRKPGGVRLELLRLTHGTGPNQEIHFADVKLAIRALLRKRQRRKPLNKCPIFMLLVMLSESSPQRLRAMYIVVELVYIQNRWNGLGGLQWFALDKDFSHLSTDAVLYGSSGVFIGSGLSSPGLGTVLFTF